MSHAQPPCPTPSRRQRRPSLPSSFSSPSHRKRRSLQVQPPLPPALDSDYLRPIPRACPPFMPMYRPTLSRTNSSSSVSNSASTSTSVGQDNSTRPPSRTASPSSPRLSQSKTFSRVQRHLHRWTGGQQQQQHQLHNELPHPVRELDFGCAGEWHDGQADSGFYSSYPGGVDRLSSASSVEIPSLTHSRGHSTSSDYSFSTVASSVPPSPTLPFAPESKIPLSRVPLTPRTAHRRRQSDEDAAVDAVNEYFTRVRLSQIAEAPSPRTSLSAKTVRGSVGGAGGSRRSWQTDEPVPAPPTGLAIFGTSEDLSFDLDFDSPSSSPVESSLGHPTRTLHHSRSTSHDLEIEFIETGHTTYTPLSADPEAHKFPATFLLPEDAFVFPAHSRSSAAADISPAPSSDFGTIDSHDSTETIRTDDSETTTLAALRHRSPIHESDFAPTLDELSEYFGASSSASSSRISSTYVPAARSPSPSPAPPPVFRTRHQHHASLPSLLPPVPISPLRKQNSRFGVSPMSSPRLGTSPLIAISKGGGARSGRSFGAGASFSGFLPSYNSSTPYQRTHKRQSASFAAAQRAKAAQSGMASPTMRVTYDWI